MAAKPHSQEQFTKGRNLWWHDDYLDLLARRLELKSRHSVLELGAGIGHWTEPMMARCAAGASFTVVDKEAVWVSELEARFADRPGFKALQADVIDLRALSGPYDLVTCQTVLMHVADVPGVLTQARALLEPGGMLLLVEPNNFLNRLPITSVTASLSPAEFGEVAAFWWAFERGREKLGLGREWIAELLPKLIVDAGFERLQVFQNDRAWPEFPPYDSPERSAAAAESCCATTSQGADDDWRDEARRFVLAGGVDQSTCERALELIEEIDRRTAQALKAGTYSYSGVGTLCIFAARNPLR